ncbi:LEAF RUST 10 DISEASE-RESISTANCE LOCUS RECEPTOR-LIKE PROTEIN KINASE-like 2.5 [Dioscorea cayenensis subsp. rotundata]|uniref:LEAF RUST 10 DISEASE-RESISTANCE LOCUS RECEPTOR-LIKE PROTEIN KINASE-like 2.5 n=1 Tax=Dioscorea cayennensis subsp. rotundata TaxID=55577 RepID=A0AB40AM62_DIOCR|nr:LEAF RUST 10 DISEASE-RESISTANCE LOCUS RECEPTOR-LIKE PROTEIN KINASE-like 2.5 [Dioscorea cayenensis subsp. rotundata]
MSITYLLFQIFILLTTHTILGLASIIQTTIPSCPQTYPPCGNLSDVHYPFSLSNNPLDPPFSSCGYPGLTIFCLNNTIPILLLNSNTRTPSPSDGFTVTNINYSSNTFDITDNNELINDYCSIINSNLTLDVQSFLSFTEADANLTVFIDCLGEGPKENMIKCFNNTDTKNTTSYVFFPPDVPIPGGNDFYQRCGQVVIVPVLRQGVLDYIEDQEELGVVFGEVLKKGFQIGWDPAASLEECRTCEKSNGRCGFKVTNASVGSNWEITCFCSDGSQGSDSCGTLL